MEEGKRKLGKENGNEGKNLEDKNTVTEVGVWIRRRECGFGGGNVDPQGT